MAICMMPSQMENMQEWKTIFPKGDYTTLQGSAAFIKKLIAVSLSSITYMRGIFPERAYGDMKLGGLKLKLLTEDSGIKAVTKFIDLIRGCYDAVEKKYLHQLAVGICLNPENRNDVVEAYKLEFRYKDDECSITCHNKTNIFSPKQNDPTVKASFLMLKNIYSISNLLGNLPKNAYISIKLLYYDDVTPPDYEPPGFEPSPHAKFNFPEKCLNIHLGQVDTEYNGFTFLLKSAMRRHSQSQYSSEDPGSMVLQSTFEEKKRSDEETGEIRQSSQGSKVQGQVLDNIPTDSSLQCPCGCKSANNSNSIICKSCETMHHKSCYGISRQEDIPAVFYCVNCIIFNSDGNPPLDLVYKYQGKKRQELCSMRRALALCTTHEIVTKTDLEKKLGCTKAAAIHLIERLEFEGFIRKSCGRGRYSVDKEYINECGWPQYFSSNEDQEDDNQMFQNGSMNHSPSQENEEVEEYIPETENKENDYRTLKKKNSETVDQMANPTFENSGYSTLSLSEMFNVESSIRKVKKLSLSNVSPDGTATRKSRKRKASCPKTEPIDDSEELFQSPKKRRTKKRA